MKRKKYLASLFLFMLLLIPAAGNEKQICAAENKLSGWENPKGIILASPADGYQMTAESASILGSCDPRYPLYRNGKRIETTKHGFFTEYVPLKPGKNTFTYRNGDKFKMITIVRVEGSGGGSSLGYSAFTADKYGVMTMDYATHRAKPDSSDELLTPLNSGTVFRVFGTENGYYKISDGTYVNQAVVKLYDGKLKDNKVKSVKVSENSDKNSIELTFYMDQNALYAVDTAKDQLTLTLYDTAAGVEARILEHEWISEIAYKRYKKEKKLVYRISLKDGKKLNGYDVVFTGDGLVLSLKKPPKLSGSHLKGAVIVLDAGHGDDDSGAVGPPGAYGPMEKDLNLYMAMFVKESLESKGAKVIMVREDDTFYKLSERTALIKSTAPDLSVSLHHNSLAHSADYMRTKGYLTFYSYDLFHDMAGQINGQIQQEAGFEAVPARQRNLALTRITNCPALLLEIGFVSNPADYEFLIQEKNQKFVAQAIANSIESYLRSIAD